MNADIKGMLDFYKHKKMDRILQADDGTFIPSKDAKKYLNWCLKNGYKDLYSAPDYSKYEKLTRTCNDCKNRERWECGGSIIQYCSIIKSRRTGNGLKKIKCKNAACGYFKKLKDGEE